MSEAVDSVKRRLVYIPDDEQVMLSELSGAPSHRASRMSRLLITRSPCLSEGNRTPPEPSFASTSPSLEDLPPTTSLVMLSSSAANCLYKASDTKHIKQSTPHKHVNNNVFKKQQTGDDDDDMRNGTTYESKEEDKMTEVTQVGKTRNKRCRAHIADASQHTFTPTPLPRRGATPVVDKTKVDALLLVSYDGFLLADGSGHIRPPRTAAEARKIIHALEQCKVYLTECASSASLSSLFKPVDVPTLTVTSERTPLPTSVHPLEQKEEQLQELKQEEKEQEEEQELEQEKELTESGAGEENDSWNDDEFTNLSSSSSATSNSLLSEASSEEEEEEESLSDNWESEEEEEELESVPSSSSRSDSAPPTKRQKTQNISQQQKRQIKKSKPNQAKRVGNATNIKQRTSDKINSCNRVKTSNKSTKQHVTQQCVNHNVDEFDFNKLSTMTAKALREMLGEYGLSTNGSKCVLRSRLKRYLKRKQTLEEKESEEEVNRHMEQLESARDSTDKTNASSRNYRRSSRSSKSRSSSVLSEKKSDESTPDLSISFSTSTDDHNSNRTSSLISRRSTCLPELTTSTETAINNTIITTSTTRNSVPLISPSSVTTTPAQSTRLELLRSSYTAPTKPNGGFWNTLMTAGSRLFSRSSNVADNCSGKFHSQEMGRAESLPSYKRHRSA